MNLSAGPLILAFEVLQLRQQVQALQAEVLRRREQVELVCQAAALANLREQAAAQSREVQKLRAAEQSKKVQKFRAKLREESQESTRQLKDKIASLKQLVETIKKEGLRSLKCMQQAFEKEVKELKKEQAANLIQVKLKAELDHDAASMREREVEEQVAVAEERVAVSEAEVQKLKATHIVQMKRGTLRLQAVCQKTLAPKRNWKK
jgi:hypothetical protein